MRKQKFTEEQIAFVLKQVEHGAPLGVVSRILRTFADGLPRRPQIASDMLSA